MEADTEPVGEEALDDEGASKGVNGKEGSQAEDDRSGALQTGWRAGGGLETRAMAFDCWREAGIEERGEKNESDVACEDGLEASEAGKAKESW